jgi:type III secretion system low calcium response chaperone LcrH/SycD
VAGSNSAQSGGMQQFMQDIAGFLASGGTLGDLQQFEPRHYEALYTIGHSLYQRACYEQAIPVFSLLVSRNHQEPRFMLALAAACQMAGRYKQALELYIAVVLLKVDDPMPVVHSAECLIALGNTAEARKSLELAVTLCVGAEHEIIKTHAAALLRALKHTPARNARPRRGAERPPQSKPHS